jgi:chromosome segregation ATPase
VALLAKRLRERSQAHRSDLKQALAELKKEKARRAELRSNLSGHLKLAAAFDAQKEETSAALEAAQKIGAAASETVAVELQFRDRALQRRAAVKDELRREADALRQQREAAEAQFSAIESLLALWRDHAGLDIQRVAPSTVRITLTFAGEVHDKDWSVAFTLALADAKQDFTVSDVSPALPAASLADLLARLNRDRSTRAALPAFICGMRKLFLGRSRSRPACGGA